GGFAEFAGVVVRGAGDVGALGIAEHSADAFAVVEDQGELQAGDVVLLVVEPFAGQLAVVAVITQHIVRDMVRAEVGAVVVGPGGLALVIGIGIRVAAVVVNGHAGGVGEDTGGDLVDVDVFGAGHGVDVRLGVDLLGGDHVFLDAGEDLSGRVIAAGGGAGGEDGELLVRTAGPLVLGVLGAGGFAARVVDHEAAVIVVEGPRAAGVNGLPLVVVVAAADGVLDELAAIGGDRAADIDAEAGIHVLDVIVTALFGRREGPFQAGAGGLRLLQDRRRARRGGDAHHHAAGDVLDVVGCAGRDAGDLG